MRRDKSKEIKGEELLKLAKCDILSQIKTHIPQGIRALELGEEVERTAKRIVDRYVNELGCPVGTPTVFAASVIYIASIMGGERRTQKKVCDVYGIHPPALKCRYIEICDKLEIGIIL